MIIRPCPNQVSVVLTVIQQELNLLLKVTLTPSHCWFGSEMYNIIIVALY